jgi:hypothetical protein
VGPSCQWQGEREKDTVLGGRLSGPWDASVVGLETVPEAFSSFSFLFSFLFLVLFETLLQRNPIRFKPSCSFVKFSLCPHRHTVKV